MLEYTALWLRDSASLYDKLNALSAPEYPTVMSMNRYLVHSRLPRIGNTFQLKACNTTGLSFSQIGNTVTTEGFLYRTVAFNHSKTMGASFRMFFDKPLMCDQRIWHLHIGKYDSVNVKLTAYHFLKFSRLGGVGDWFCIEAGLAS